MLSFPVSYLSRNGPNVPGTDPLDVRFLQVCADYSSALTRLDELQALHPSHRIVLYRASRANGEFSFARQRPNGAGAYPPEPTDVPRFAFVLFAAPPELVQDGVTTTDAPQLADEVANLWRDFGQGDPTNAGPHIVQPNTAK